MLSWSNLITDIAICLSKVRIIEQVKDYIIYIHREFKIILIKKESSCNDMISYHLPYIRFILLGVN